jgi:hypothetical protein
MLGSPLASIPVQDRFPTASLTIFPQFCFLHSGVLITSRNSHINTNPFVAHGLLRRRALTFFRPFAFAHRTFAAFLAISFRFFGDKSFIFALADFRPSAEKYSDSFLSITDTIMSTESTRYGRP